MHDPSSAVLPTCEPQDAGQRSLEAQIPTSRPDPHWPAYGKLPAGPATKEAGALVEHVAHELRSPLTVINEYASLLRDEVAGPLNEEQRGMLEILTDRVQDLNTAVDDLVDMSRLQSGTLCASQHNCRVSDLVKDIQSRLERKSTAKEIALEVDVPDGLPEVYCDAERMRRVLLNMTSDAIKASGPQGNVRLSCGLDRERHEIAIHVTHDHDASGIRSFNGFGAAGAMGRGEHLFWSGLKIQRELAEMILSTMHAENGPGQQSTLRLTLPLAEPVEIAARHIERLRRIRHRPFAASLLMAGMREADGTGEKAEMLLDTLPGPDDLVFRVGRAARLIAVTGDQEDLNRCLRWGDQTPRPSGRQGVPPDPRDKAATSGTMEMLGTWVVPKDRTLLLEAVRRASERESAR
jgi:hypothetical protein